MDNKPGDSASVPTKVKFNLTFIEQANTYFETSKNPTLKEFAIQLGVDETTLLAWAAKKKKDEQGNVTDQLARPNFNAAIAKIKQGKSPEVIKTEEIKQDVPKVEEKVDNLNPQQTFFCKLYIQNTELFGNATLSYALAYGYDFEILSTERQKDENGKEIKGSSEYEKVYDMCSAAGSRLLRNVKVNDYVRVCLNELLNDKVVDSELARVILQNYKLEPKVAAIKEYNKLKQRITDKIDHTTKGEKMIPIMGGAAASVSSNDGNPQNT